MKRDPDLIRNILMAVEAADKEIKKGSLSFPGYTPDQIDYHVEILCDAGLIDATYQRTFGSSFWMIRRLTWSGHDFLEAARNDTIWNKAKARMEEMGGFVLELAKPLMIEFIKQQIGL